MPSSDTTMIGMPGCAGEQVTRQEGPEPEHRADRQVDVAGDDDERLADGEDREDRGVEGQVAQRVGLDEARLEDRRDRDEQEQRRDDPELADAQDPIGEARARGGRRSADAAWCSRRAHARWPRA